MDWCIKEIRKEKIILKTQVKRKNNISITLKTKKQNKKKRIYKRGDVVKVDLGKAKNNIKAGVRLAVIVSNNGVNTNGDYVLIAPLTNAIHKTVDGVVKIKRGQYHLSKNKYAGLKYSSIVQTVDVRPYMIEDIICKYETLDDDDMKGISRELQYTLGILK